jgi:hypothetical protein
MATNTTAGFTCADVVERGTHLEASLRLCTPYVPSINLQIRGTGNNDMSSWTFVEIVKVADLVAYLNNPVTANSFICGNGNGNITRRGNTIQIAGSGNRSAQINLDDTRINAFMTYLTLMYQYCPVMREIVNNTRAAVYDLLLPIAQALNIPAKSLTPYHTLPPRDNNFNNQNNQQQNFGQPQQQQNFGQPQQQMSAMPQMPQMPQMQAAPTSQMSQMPQMPTAAGPMPTIPPMASQAPQAAAPTIPPMPAMPAMPGMPESNPNVGDAFRNDLGGLLTTFTGNK